jgi:serine/threonine-protein kinase
MNQPVTNQECLLEGEIFEGRFEILSLVSVGGVGAVYKARHTHMNKTVAIKVLLPSLGLDDADLLRFEQEARTASNLTHSNIVSIFDFGIATDGNAYLVMEYLDGCNLDDLIEQEGHLNPDLFHRIFSQVCDALHHAHRRGVVHRDIKPSNIMLIDTEETSCVVKLVDFGLAKLIAPELQQNLTHAGVAMGTPLYMSPEQCRGAQLDHRSDIYSLGCVMYAALTGKVPFLGDSAMNTLSKHLLDPPPPFSVSAPELNLPKSLEHVILKALQKDPEARQQSMIELRNDIANAIYPGNGAGMLTNVSEKEMIPSVPSLCAESASKAESKPSSQFRVASSLSHSADATTPVKPRTLSLPALSAILLVGSGVILLSVSSWYRIFSPKLSRVPTHNGSLETMEPPNSIKSNIVVYDRSAVQKSGSQKPASTPHVVSKVVSPSKQPALVKHSYNREANGLSTKEAAMRVASFEQEAVRELKDQDFRAARASYEACLQCQQSMYQHDDPRLFFTIGHILSCMEHDQFESQFASYLDQGLSIFNGKRPAVMHEVGRSREAPRIWATFGRACARTAQFFSGSSKDNYLSWAADFYYLALESCPDERKTAVATAYCWVLEARGNAADAAAVRQKYSLPPPVKVDMGPFGQNLALRQRRHWNPGRGIWQR